MSEGYPVEEIQLIHFQKEIDTIIKAVIHSHRPVVISDKGKFLVRIVPIVSSEQPS